MKNVCIVGYGAIGPVHAKALETTDRARLYAVCDVDPGRREACRAQYGAVAYEDFDRMLQDPDIQSVHICTPHYLHYEMIRRALEAGKDVVAEKPLTRTEEELDALLKMDGAERVCVVFQNRLNPGIVKLRELIREGGLGKVKAVKAALTWHRDRAYYEQGGWRGRYATEGGGLMINQAIHTLDYFSYLFGGAETVRALTANFSLEDAIEVEDTCMAHLGLPGGVSGVFYATNGYGENSAPFLETVFEKGTVRYRDNQLWCGDTLLAEDEPPKTGKAYWGSSHERLIRRYYDEGKYFSPRDAENTMRTLFAVYRSAAQGGVEIRIG